MNKRVAKKPGRGWEGLFCVLYVEVRVAIRMWMGIRKPGKGRSKRALDGWRHWLGQGNFLPASMIGVGAEVGAERASH
jgi:hypothetical protein